MMNNYVIDAHSHIGYETDDYIIGANYNWPIMPTLDLYNPIAIKNNIGLTLFSPCTSPVIIDKKSNYVETLIVWEYNSSCFKCYTQYKFGDGSLVKEPVKCNPYKKINDLLYDYLNNYPNYYFVPAINLIYDTRDYIIELIEKGVKAFKIHGISIGLDDFSKINFELLKILKTYDIPLVIHTDYSKNQLSSLNKLYSANNPINWIKLLKQYNVRGYLVHGCRLSLECAKLLNDSKGQFLVGISPDLLLNTEEERLMINTNNYLKSLFEIFNSDQLSFDIDFGWNILNRNDMELDDNQLNRMEKYFSNESNRQKVLRKNSQSFFKLG